MPRRAASILAATLPLLAAALCVAAEKPAAPPEAADPAAVHAKAVAELTAKLADPSQEVRKRATLAYERLVFHASRPGAEPERAAAAKAAIDALGTDVPRPVVLALLGTLEYVGRDEAVPCLARLIGHADPLVRERARRALLANPSPKALEPRSYQDDVMGLGIVLDAHWGGQTPAVFVYDRKGKQVYKGHGADALGQAAAAGAAAPAPPGPPPPAAAGRPPPA